MQNTFTAAKT